MKISTHTPASNSSSRSIGNLFSVLQAVRANTYGQIVLRNAALFGFFHKKSSYMLEKRDETSLRLLGFVGYVAYSVESGSLRRHKTLAVIEEVNAEATDLNSPSRFYVTPRQMICLVYDGNLSTSIEDADLSLLLSFVVEALLVSSPLTARIAEYAVSGEHLRSL